MDQNGWRKARGYLRAYWEILRLICMAVVIVVWALTYGYILFRPGVPLWGRAVWLLGNVELASRVSALYLRNKMLEAYRTRMTMWYVERQRVMREAARRRSQNLASRLVSMGIENALKRGEGVSDDRSGSEYVEDER